MRLTMEGDGLDAFALTLDRYRQHVEDSQPIMASVMVALEDMAETGFSRSARPGSSRWPALSPGYAAWKRRHYGSLPILTREGTLRASLNRTAGPGAVREVESGFLRYGTAVPYAAYHQNGTATMPPRPVLPSRRGRMPAVVGKAFHERMFEGVV